MKILHIINNIDRGGAETLLLNIIDQLQQKDSSYEISVLILEDKQYLRSQFDTAGIKVECVDCLNKPLLVQVYDIWKYVRGQRPDIVHTHLLKSDLVGLPAAYLAGVRKLCSTVHSMEKCRNKKEKLSRWVVSAFSNSIIMVSESAKKHFEVTKEYSRKKMVVIHNAAGFSVEGVLPKASKRNPLRLIQVARLNKAKGQIYLLQAMKILQDRKVNCVLTIFGDGYERNNLERYINELNLNNVILAGSTNDVPKELKKSDVFIASSLWEGFPLALVEAIMMALPVVATSIGPHKEILGSSYEFIVPPGEPEELANKIVDMQKLTNEKYCQLSEYLLGRSKLFSMKKMIDNYDNFYREL